MRERLILYFGSTAIIGEIVMCALAPNDGAAYYLFGLAVVLSFGAVLIAPSAKITAQLFFVLGASYALMLPFFSIELLPLIVNSLFVLLIATAATIGAFERERLERLQAISENELARINLELLESKKEALRARDKEIEANRAKNNFIASVSHELRTPLNAIIGFSDVMRNELYGAVQPAAYGEYVNFIHSSGKILQTNISDLMDLARIESGKLGWVDVKFSLAEKVEHAVATCDALADETDVSLAFEAEINDVFVYADPARITQAVINLITNALKFTDTGGRVVVSMVMTNDGSITVSVADTGCGMNAEALEKIHEPYAQAHDDSAGVAKGGLGLGLAIVCGILDQIDGRLEIDSDVGVGTCAKLIIPADRISSAAMKAA